VSAPLAEPMEAVIGLEVHVQLKTRTKIFCACSAAYGAPPNTHVCPVCLGHPGVLPVLNREAVAFALRFGLAVGATIGERSVFARKNYFYPDLPKGYQISQYETPILAGGRVSFRSGEGTGSARLVRAHLEEDAGKSFHPEAGREAATLVDLNRSGVPLLEVVSEPDLRSADDAQAFLERIHQLVVYLDICDGNLEEGSLRCDANVSVRPRGETALYAKTEIKNLNSFRNVHRALLWEIRRQSQILEDGGALVQTTRLWDAGEGRTRVMRTKEDAEDYRYFPDPDLLPLAVDAAWVETERARLPELPWQVEDRFREDYGLGAGDAVILAATRAGAAFFETAARAAGDGKAAANWVLSEVLHRVKTSPAGWDGLRFTAEHLGRLVRAIDEERISGKMGKAVFAEMAETGGDPEAIIAARGLVQVDDPDELARVVEEALAAHPGPVGDYLGGKASAFQFLIGQVMRLTQGRANPRAARDAMEKALRARSAGPEAPEGGTES